MNRATVQQLRYEKLGIISFPCKDQFSLPLSLSEILEVKKTTSAINFGKVKVDCFVTTPSFG